MWPAHTRSGTQEWDDCWAQIKKQQIIAFSFIEVKGERFDTSQVISGQEWNAEHEIHTHILFLITVLDHWNWETPEMSSKHVS